MTDALASLLMLYKNNIRIHSKTEEERSDCECIYLLSICAFEVLLGIGFHNKRYGRVDRIVFFRVDIFGVDNE